MSAAGWIKLHRVMMESWFGRLPGDQFKIAVFLIIKANWTSGSVMSGGVRVEIPRGSLMTGREALALSTGTSVQVVRTALKTLEAAGFLTIKSTKRFTMISIVNYDTYQDVEDDDNHRSNQQSTNNQPTDNQQLTTIEEGKKERREEEQEQDPPVSPPGDAGQVAQLSLAGEPVCDKAERAKLGERAANEGYARELVGWLNGKRRELTPGIQGHGFNPLAADVLKAAARLRKARVPIAEAIAALELRLASYRRIGPDAARNNLTPATMLNTKLAGFFEQVRAGHTYAAEGGKPQDVRVGRLEPHSREFFQAERDAGEEF